MPICTAVQEGSWVVVKNENNQEIFRKPGELHNYNPGNSVTVRVKEEGNTFYWLFVYDEQGNEIGKHTFT
jgi:hypothetical protein